MLMKDKIFVNGNEEINVEDEEEINRCQVELVNEVFKSFDSIYSNSSVYCISFSNTREYIIKALKEFNQLREIFLNILNEDDIKILKENISIIKKLQDHRYSCKSKDINSLYQLKNGLNVEKIENIIKVEIKVLDRFKPFEESNILL